MKKAMYIVFLVRTVRESWKVPHTSMKKTQYWERKKPWIELFKKRGNEYVHGLSNFNYNNQSGACEYLLYYLVIQRVYRSDKVDGGKGIKRVGRG